MYPVRGLQLEIQGMSGKVMTPDASDYSISYSTALAARPYTPGLSS